MAGSGYPGGGLDKRNRLGTAYGKRQPKQRGPWAVKITREAPPRAHYLPDMWLPYEDDVQLHRLDPLQFALRVTVTYRATFKTKGAAIAAILGLEMPELEFEIVNLKRYKKPCSP